MKYLCFDDRSIKFVTLLVCTATIVMTVLIYVGAFTMVDTNNHLEPIKVSLKLKDVLMLFSTVDRSH